MPDSSGRVPAYIDPQFPNVRPMIFQPDAASHAATPCWRPLLGISGGAYDLTVTTSRILPLTWGNPRTRERNRTADLRITRRLAFVSDRPERSLIVASCLVRRFVGASSWFSWEQSRTPSEQLLGTMLGILVTRGRWYMPYRGALKRGACRPSLSCSLVGARL